MKLVIFDWDGTLMDSTGRIVDCMHKAAADLKLEKLSEQAVQQIIGLGLPLAIKTLYPALTDKDVELMRQRYSAHFIEAEAVPNALFDGVEPLLEALAAQGRHLAVATGKSRAGLSRVWGNTGYDRFFHASRCADESQSKPQPHMVLELLDELAVKPEQAVVVGDTSHDLLMAQNANVAAIGVTWGAHDQAQLEACNPSRVVSQVDELTRLLLSELQVDNTLLANA